MAGDPDHHQVHERVKQMYHSLIINVGDDYINTWDDWFLIPSSKPVIAPPIERTNFVTVPGRDGALDYSQSVAKKAVFDNRTGKIEFYLENDMPNWDWETAYTTICETLKGRRVRMALEDNPAHYYEGLLWVNQYKSDKGHSKITLEYNLHPTMHTLNVGAVVMNAQTLRLTKGMEFQILVGVGPTNTFFRRVNVTAKPKGIVEITKHGTIRGLKKGTAVVAAECGGVSAECAVTVGSFETHAIIRELTGCTETNPVNAVTDGGSYQNILAVKDRENTTLTVSLTVNGTDRTAEFVTVGTDELAAQIKMESVEGDVKITAAAVEKPQPQMLCDIPIEPSAVLKRANGSFRM